MRAPSNTDFILPVEGIGNFTFARKKLRDQISIECEYSRLTEGIDAVTTFLDVVASAMANLTVMTVEAPEGWDLAEMDPEDTETYNKLLKVWGALRDKWESFRPAVEKVGETGGAGAVKNP